MSEIIRIDAVTVDLDKPLFRSSAGKVLATGDQLANRYAARAMRNGEPVNLAGYVAKGYFTTPSRETIIVSGSVVGNMAYVDLPRACYREEGLFSLALKVENSSVTQTLRVIEGWIVPTQTGDIDDGGSGGGDTSQLFYTADGSVFQTLDDALFYVVGG